MGKSDEVTGAFKLIREALFIVRLWNLSNPPICPYYQELLSLNAPINRMDSPLYCGKFDQEEEDVDDLEKQRHLSFKELKGSRNVQEKKHEWVGASYMQPLKLWKVNIVMEEKPKLTSIAYYWDG